MKGADMLTLEKWRQDNTEFYCHLATVFDRVLRDRGLGLNYDLQQEPIEFALARRDQTVLEIGCGNGRVVEYLLGRPQSEVGKIVVIESSRTCCENVRQRFGNQDQRLTIWEQSIASPDMPKEIGR